MSAFICSDRHISTLVYYYGTNVNLLVYDEIIKIAKVLLKENVKSVNYRYNAKYKTKLKSFDPKTSCSLVELYKLANCWEYQTCEHPNHEKSNAWKIIQALKLNILDKLIQSDKFRFEYDIADWDI